MRSISIYLSLLLPLVFGQEIYARQIAAGSLTFEEYEAENRWVLKEDLYREMLEDSTWYAGDSVLMQFRDTTSLNDIGGLATIEDIASTEYPSTLQTAINDILTQIDNMQGLIDANIALLDTTQNDTLRSLLLQQITNQKTQLEILNATFSELRSQVEEIDSLRVMQILYHNQGLEAEVAYSYHTKIVNELYYTHFQRDSISIDSTELTTLWSIAGLCPSAGGPAVYQARAMLRVLGYNPDFADYDLCAVAQSPWRVAENHDTILAFTVYPNPTTGELYITHNADFAHQAWKLYNIMGQVVKMGVFSEQETEKIDISGYISGVYLLQTSNNVTKIILQ